MKKILILANNDVGLYKFRKELIVELLNAYEVHISLPHGPYVDELVQMGCVFHPTDFNRHGMNPLKDLALLKAYKVLIRKVKPIVVLTYTIKPNIYGGIACAAFGVPYITNITGLGTAVENKGILQVVTTTLYKFALRKANKVFFQNEDNLQFMRYKKIVKENYDCLPGSGVNLQQHQPMPYPSGNTVNFIFVARVMKEKGIDQYLDAATYIRKKYPNTQFHVCGMCDGPYEDILKEAVCNGDIVYHGIVKDMNSIYEMGSCTVHPSYYPEGMSNVLLETCASARPIITTNRAGCREIVDDGMNGFICNSKDSADLIRQIERFLALDVEARKIMGEYGRKKVEKEFDRTIVIEKYLREIVAHG